VKQSQCMMDSSATHSLGWEHSTVSGPLCCTKSLSLCWLEFNARPASFTMHPHPASPRYGETTSASAADLFFAALRSNGHCRSKLPGRWITEEDKSQRLSKTILILRENSCPSGSLQPLRQATPVLTNIIQYEHTAYLIAAFETSTPCVQILDV
jgi:hypothetical protein